MTIEDRARKYWDERINHSGDSLIRIVTNFTTQEVKAERKRLGSYLQINFPQCDHDWQLQKLVSDLMEGNDVYENGGTE